jgi:hypothetical protein
MEKKFIFHIFSYNLPAGTLSSVLKIKFFAKILCSNFILQALFQSAENLYEKGSVADPGVYPGSRILIFTHPGSRIQKQQQKRGVKKNLLS